MIYAEAMNYIRNIERAGIDLGLERMRELLDLLGAPDRGLKCVHVAGTNGKGSVCAYLTSILKAAGYKVGTYNSPSVFSYNERWLIGGAPLSDEDVAKYMSIVAEVIERENFTRQAAGKGSFTPTAFEIETAIAFYAFGAEGCDACVIETGLGGRWDATNAMDGKLLSVITPIGLDHTAYLGDTLEKIAAEKAAITDGTCVTAAANEEVMRELARPFRIVDGVKKYMPCKLIVASDSKPVSSDLSGQTFEYDGKRYFIKMLGDHQLINAGIAICASKALAEKGLDIDDESIRKGLAETEWHARFEVIQSAQNRFNLHIPTGKTLVLDGAHNPHGALTLKASMQKYFPGKRVHLVMGALKDKDVEGVARLIAPLCARATAVTAPSPRAMDAEQLKDILSKYVPCGIGRGINSAVRGALAGDCDAVLLAGSLTLFEKLGETI